MEKVFNKMLAGYKQFRQKYASGNEPLMQQLSEQGQKPDIMFIACSDSRVDPAILLQCDPGELFVVRNVANLVPPYESDGHYHGTSAAMEFGICYLNVKHLVILGHSQCGGIQAKVTKDSLHQDDFISHWMNIATINEDSNDIDCCAQQSLCNSYQNCLTFPWIKQRIIEKTLKVHLWYLDISKGCILVHDETTGQFIALEE